MGSSAIKAAVINWSSIKFSFICSQYFLLSFATASSNSISSGDVDIYSLKKFLSKVSSVSLFSSFVEKLSLVFIFKSSEDFIFLSSKGTIIFWAEFFSKLIVSVIIFKFFLFFVFFSVFVWDFNLSLLFSYDTTFFGCALGFFVLINFI